MMKLWIVTAINYDIDGNCFGKPEVVYWCKFRNYAEDYVKEDILDWVDQHAGESEYDLDKMCAWCKYDDSIRCEWNIEEIEVDVNN